MRVVRLPYLSFAPLYIGEAEGYFSEQNLEIEFVELRRSAEALAALARGQLEVSAGVLSAALLSAISQGARIRIVADKGCILSSDCVNSALVVRPEVVGKLDTPDGLKQLRFCTTNNTTMTRYLEVLLHRMGLSPDDVEIVQLPRTYQTAALKNGAIDVASATEPWLTQLKEEGIAVQWLSCQDLIPEIQIGVITYGPTLLDENRDVGQRFMSAYLKAVRCYNEGKTERNLSILAKSTGVDAELLRKACWLRINETGDILLDSVVEFQDWALKNHTLDRPVPVEQFWDPSFAEFANQSLD